MTHDPVCGMPVSTESPWRWEQDGRTYAFCSDLCRQLFLRQPQEHIDRAERRAEVDGRQAALVAYFSMEIALESAIPTYSGGLGVLAGDTLRACADMAVPIVGVTLVHRCGYFEQVLDEQGRQSEKTARWNPEQRLERLDPVVEVQIDGRPVRVGAWLYRVEGAGGRAVSVILVDTDRPENSEADRWLTDHLYGGDARYRLMQEAVLGIGGVRMLRALGYSRLRRFHMNEGHSALLALELLREEGLSADHGQAFESVRRRCVFTTHTPVPAGHDRFDWRLARAVLGGDADIPAIRMLGGETELNMTYLALNTSGFVNGVAKRHGEVSRAMFPNYPISSITNGVHPWTWTADSFRELYDRHIPGWRTDPAALRAALGIARSEIWQAHQRAKRDLLAAVRRSTGVAMNQEVLTVGFARRATPYKRTMLLFRDLERLREIGQDLGGLQLVFAGKAHPQDAAGKELIEQVHRAARAVGGDVRVAYMPNYDMQLARLLVSGCDLWLNTPRKPQEASGTSGMKAALNGVPQLSVLDGWWLEGHIEGVTGWAIGTSMAASNDDYEESRELYNKLAITIGRLYRSSPDAWIDVMRHAIAINGSFFTAHRMVSQYLSNAYLA